MRGLTAFLAGLLFGMGLLLAGMANPAKVQAFLDLAGAWDPSLALVMVGAIAVALLPMQWARGQSQALLGGAMCLPGKRAIDRPLIVGSLLFGMGWGWRVSARDPRWPCCSPARPAFSCSLRPCWPEWRCIPCCNGSPTDLEVIMKANVGTIDRTVRIVVGLLLIGLTLGGVIGMWGWIGLLPLATGIFRFCPAYGLLGIKTCKLRH